MRWMEFVFLSSLAVCTTCLSTSRNQIPFFTDHSESNLNPVATERDDIHKVIDHELSSYVKKMTEMWEVQGATIAVVRPDGEVEFGAWGIKTEDGDQMTPETLLNIASCSKAFLAATMGILIDDFQEGRNKTSFPTGVNSFTWNTKVKDLLPDEWEVQDPWANEKVDVLDILSHRSGLPRHDRSYSPKDTARDVITRMKHLRLAYEPRQKFAYNNQMFSTGAYIVKKYSSTNDYPAFINDRIFTPLGMKSSTFSANAAQGSGNLSQSWTAHSQRIPFWYTDSSVDMIAGAGGVISNVVDLSRWLKVLLNKGVDPTSNKTIIPRSVYDMVTTSHTLVEGNPSASQAQQFSIVGYGMGWTRTSFQGHDMVRHEGAIPGFSSSVTFFPNDGLGVAVLMNSADKAMVNEALVLRIAEDVLGLERTPRAEDPKAIYPERPRRDADASNPLPLATYTGTYHNPGYGSFTLCAPSSTSHYCASVLEDFAVVDSAKNTPLPPNSFTPQLYAEWSRFWSSHIRMVHVEDNTFEVAFTALFPQGYGASKKPFESFVMDAYAGQAKFVLDDKGEKIVGFGFFGSDDAGMHRAMGYATGIKGSSIAWFEKV